MILDLYRIDDAQARAVLEWSPEAAPVSERKPPWWLRWLVSEPRLERPLPEVAPENRLCLEKEWHGIHFLLTGSADEAPFPQGFLVDGGVVLSHTDSGYGEARLFDARRVADMAAHLESITVDELAKRYDPKAMADAEIYQAPDAENPMEAEQSLTAFLSTYGEMRKFVVETAKRNCSLLLTLT